MANIKGTQTVNDVLVLSVDSDPGAGVGTVAPIGSFALASDGSGMSYKSTAANTGWIKGIFAPLYGIVRYVYLIQDAADVARLGGSSDNVYNTTQTAYDAANTLQVLLGGVNKVNIIVGSTLSGVVGSLVLTANYNSNVEWFGLSQNASVIGNITGNFTTNIRINRMTMGSITTSSGTINVTAINASTGALTTSGGGTITVVARDSVIGNIVTTTTGATASGAVSLSSCVSSTIGSITQNSAEANVGTLTYTSCNNITVGNIARNCSSTTAAFNIGLFSINSCDNVRNGGWDSGLAYATGGGIIAGISVPITSNNISFSGMIRVTGYTTNAPTDVTISQLTLNNCTFSNFFLINTTIAAYDRRGGTISSVSINNCDFKSGIRIAYNPATSSTGHTLQILNTKIVDALGGASFRGIKIDVLDTTFSYFEMNGCTVYDPSSGTGIEISNDPATTVPFTVDGTSILIRNNTSETFSLSINDAGSPNSIYDAVLDGNNFFGDASGTGSYFFSLGGSGDINFLIQKTNANNVYLIGSGSIKRTVIETSNLVISNVADVTGLGPTIVGIPLTLKNSNLAYYTDGANSVDLISYSSFFESYATVATVTTFTGTINTSTMRILVTDDTTGITNNVSYIETY